MGGAFHILVPWAPWGPQVGPADGLADEGNPALAFVLVLVLVVDRDIEDAQVGALAFGGPSLQSKNIRATHS